METNSGRRDAPKPMSPAQPARGPRASGTEIGSAGKGASFAALSALALGLSALLVVHAPQAPRSDPAAAPVLSPESAPVQASAAPASIGPEATVARREGPYLLKIPDRIIHDSPAPVWGSMPAAPAAQVETPRQDAPPAALPIASAEVARRAVSPRPGPRLKIIGNFSRMTREEASSGGFRMLRLDDERARRGDPTAERQASVDAPSASAEARVDPPVPGGVCESGRCSDAAAAHEGGVGHRSGVLAGKKRFLGMCGDSYTYELYNLSGRPWSKVRSLDRPEVWDVSVAPGASAVIKSPAPLGRLSVDY